MPKIAAVQMSMSADAGENYMKSVQAVSEAAANGADLVCFPEGQFGRYVAQYPNLKTNAFAMPMEHEYVKGMRSACAQHRVMACISLYADLDFARCAALREKTQYLKLRRREMFTL